MKVQLRNHKSLLPYSWSILPLAVAARFGPLALPYDIEATNLIKNYALERQYVVDFL